MISVSHVINQINVNEEETMMIVITPIHLDLKFMEAADQVMVATEAMAAMEVQEAMEVTEAMAAEAMEAAETVAEATEVEAMEAAVMETVVTEADTEVEADMADMVVMDIIKQEYRAKTSELKQLL